MSTNELFLTSRAERGSPIGNAEAESLPSRLILASKEGINLFADGNRAFEIRKMSAIFNVTSRAFGIA